MAEETPKKKHGCNVDYENTFCGRDNIDEPIDDAKQRYDYIEMKMIISINTWWCLLMFKTNFVDDIIMYCYLGKYYPKSKHIKIKTAFSTMVMVS